MKSTSMGQGAARGRSWMVLAAVLLIGSVLSGANTEARTRELFGDVQGGVAVNAKRRPTDKRIRRVKVDLSALAGADLPAGADSIDLNLFADTNLTVVKKRFERRGARHFTWVGKVPDDPLSMVVLVAGDGQMQGTIFARGKHFSIRGAEAALQEVAEVDQSAFPPEACDQIPPGDQALAATAPQDALSDTGTLIDVLVVYTPAARIAQGGATPIRNLAQLAVDTTNTTYTNSGVATRLRLAHTEEVAYTESGNWNTDLNRLTGTSDGFMDAVHILRDTYRADVVALLVKDPLICGLSAATMATASTAFCLVSHDCTVSNYSFGHEIGHLQGARHDRYADAVGTFNHGHVDIASRQRTVMAYPDECSNSGFSCTRIPYWSNPGVLYPFNPSFPVVPSNPSGTVTWENNTRQLNESAFTVANFRQGLATLTVQSTYPAAGVTITVSPADNNALGDGSTEFQRSYLISAAVTLTAPATADSNPFGEWIGCASVGGPGNRTCAVTMDDHRTVTANYIRDTVARPTSFALVTRDDTGQAAIWELDPSTKVLQNLVWLPSSAGIGGPWKATSYSRVNASTGYALWTRGDTGQAILWTINPATGAITSWAYLSSPAGVGSPWLASSYSFVDASTAHVLWTNRNTGQAILWTVNPSAVSGGPTPTMPITAWAFLGSPAGVGANWQAGSYTQVSASTGYVLWTNSGTGQAILWTVDPSAVGSGPSPTIPYTAWAFLGSSSGVGANWQASDFELVDSSTGYVLWTNRDTGQAILWTVDPAAVSGGPTPTIPYTATAFIGSSSGAGAYWQASSYLPVNQPPTLDAIGPVTILEDAAPTVVNLSGISAGTSESQPLSVTATSSNTGLIPNPTVSYTSPVATGSLSLTPVANANGSATITVWVNDGQSTNNPVSRSFTVTVTPVNDAPTNISLSSSTLDRALPAGTAVGTLNTTDPDGDSAFTYAVASEPGTDYTLFQITGDVLQTSAVLDYTGRSSYIVRVRSTDPGALSIEKTFSVVPPAYALWTRRDTGQAVLWQLDAATSALETYAWLGSAGGVGAPWEASSYVHRDGTTGYVLWSNSTTGQALVWTVDPSAVSGGPVPAITYTAWAFLGSPTGVGAPWQATSYTYVNASTGYVLWTNRDTGQAILWTVDPSAVSAGPTPTMPITAWAFLGSPSGVGAHWQATSYAFVNASTGYLLWTNSDTGQAILWTVDPGAVSGSPTPTIPYTAWAFLGSSTGVGARWQASGYEPVNASTARLLWTNSNTGQAILWTVDPSAVSGGPTPIIPYTAWVFLGSSSGVGAHWGASSYTR